ncbi:MAG TPA: DUF58 domain-containing protein [Mycobacteriales bacterium]|nr:DUF58 domain-containing protein [Mycobacteriales bacterium]
MRAIILSLTLRGRCLLAAGVTAGAVGIGLANLDLVRVGLLLVVLPIASAGYVARTRFRLSATRRLDSARVAAGGRARVVVRLENVSRLPTGVLLVEDTVPYVLGGRPRLVVDRLPPRRPVDIGYQIDAQHRGRYTVGPLTVRLTDPFGLCEVVRSFVTSDTLIVTPEITPLPVMRLTGEWVGDGQSTARSVATHGDDDVATREYRQGDDLRRIHWRTTARRGQLTVRREEQPWQSRAAVLLDGRALAHRGDGPASSFEAAVSGVASVGLRLAQSGFAVRLLNDSGRELAAGHGVTGAGGDGVFGGRMLDALAVITASGGRSLRAGISALQQHGNEGVVVAVLGALSPDDIEQLSRVRCGTGARLGIAVILETPSWTVSGEPDAKLVIPVQQASELLIRAGWRAIVLRRGDDLSSAWSAIGSSVTAASQHTFVTATTGPDTTDMPA